MNSLPFVAVSALLLVSACSSDTPIPAIVPTVDTLGYSMGTETLRSDRSGLDGQSQTVKVAIFEHDDATGTGSVRLEPAVVSFAPDYWSSGDLIVEFAGRTYVLNDGGTAPGTVQGGSMNTNLDEGTLFNYYDGNDLDGTFMIGYATDPATVEARTDKGYYYGPFYYAGKVYDGSSAVTNEAAVGNGNIALVVDFDTDTLDGTLNSTQLGSGALTGTVSGNEFAGDIDLNGSCLAVCDNGSSAFEGTFYGTDGQHGGGVLVLEEQIGDDSYIKAAGGFVVPED